MGRLRHQVAAPSMPTDARAVKQPVRTSDRAPALLAASAVEGFSAAGEEEQPRAAISLRPPPPRLGRDGGRRWRRQQGRAARRRTPAQLATRGTELVPFGQRRADLARGRAKHPRQASAKPGSTIIPCVPFAVVYHPAFSRLQSMPYIQVGIEQDVQLGNRGRRCAIDT